MPIWTVIFLVDSQPPQRLMMLKRAAWKSFAPNMVTGVGGKEENGEGAFRCAVRELQEETGITVPLTEFARCTLDGDQHLHYFWGVVADDTLPECTEGHLEWVAIEDVLTKPIIPTTFEVMKIWQKRQFALDTRLTLHASTIGKQDTHAIVRIEQVIEGL